MTQLRTLFGWITSICRDSGDHRDGPTSNLESPCLRLELVHHGLGKAWILRHLAFGDGSVDDSLIFGVPASLRRILTAAHVSVMSHGHGAPWFDS